MEVFSHLEVRFADVAKFFLNCSLLLPEGVNAETRPAPCPLARGECPFVILIILEAVAACEAVVSGGGKHGISGRRRDLRAQGRVTHGNLRMWQDVGGVDVFAASRRVRSWSVVSWNVVP